MTDMSATPTSQLPGRRGRARQVPGLTGLRGVAVVAVVAYHLGYLRGGFVGVDLFFVLSGYLITSLLLDHPPTSFAALRRWWAGRVRRLMPASAAVVLAVLIAFVTMSGVALDALATLTWWQNWHLIAEGVPYWSRTASPLRHAWSLSIEEQFYLTWPPLMLTVLAAARRSPRVARPAVVVAGVAGVLAVASFVWAAVLSAHVDDLSRIYFGTDSRVGAILLGATAGALVHRPRSQRPWQRSALRAAPAWTAPLAIPAAAVLVVLATTMTPSDKWAYRGGLLAAAVSSLILVAAATRRGTLSRAVSGPVVQWLGSRSYAIYLWSWPTQVYLETNYPSMSRWQVALWTIAATLPLSELSMRLVEEPLRLGAGWGRSAVARRAAWGVGVVVLCAGMVMAANSTELTVQEEVAEEFEKLPDPSTTTSESAEGGQDQPVSTAPPTTVCIPAPAEPPPVFDPESGTFNPSTVEATADPTGADRCVDTIRVLVVGDSTGRGTANGLKRSASEALEIWDRTELGCGFVIELEGCTDWPVLWSAAVDEVDPDVVLVVARTSEHVWSDDGPEFMSQEGIAARRAAMADAIRMLSARGATVVWTTTAAPTGSFYCDGRAESSGCDPRWVAQWNDDVEATAAAEGAAVIDVAGWVAERDGGLEDRPDGMHLSGPALEAQAVWIQEQILAVT